MADCSASRSELGLTYDTSIGTACMTTRREILLDEVPSMCAQCHGRILAEIIDRDGRVYQRSRCPQHGSDETLIFSDSSLYRSLDRWNSLLFPDSSSMNEAAPLLAIIDLTNRCNYRCPTCFAEIGGSDEQYFLGTAEVRSMLLSLLNRSPAPCTHVQFSGGEPTLHPEFPAIVKMARDLGFSHIQVATNGHRFGDLEFTRQCEEMGLHTLYLQFDGMSDDVYMKMRGLPLVDRKIAVVENIAKTNMRIVFVPTIASSVNVDHIGPIFRFALKHSKHVTGISIQPTAHIGRLETDQKGEPPFNLADMASEFCRQTGTAGFPDDWFPLSALSLLTRAVCRMRGEVMIHPLCDAHCSIGTYFYVDDEGRPKCLNQFFDLQKFLRIAAELKAAGSGSSLGARLSNLLKMRSLSACFDERQAPRGLTFQRLLRGLEGWEDKSAGRGPGWSEKGFNGMFVAGMHFMDGHNYNLRRLQRCIIKYVTTDGRVVPFCSYNAGPRDRDAEEKLRSEAARHRSEQLR